MEMSYVNLATCKKTAPSCDAFSRVKEIKRGFHFSDKVGKISPLIDPGYFIEPNGDGQEYPHLVNAAEVSLEDVRAISKETVDVYKETCETELQDEGLTMGLSGIPYHPVGVSALRNMPNAKELNHTRIVVDAFKLPEHLLLCEFKDTHEPFIGYIVKLGPEIYSLIRIDPPLEGISPYSMSRTIIMGIIQGIGRSPSIGALVTEQYISRVAILINDQCNVNTNPRISRIHINGVLLNALTDDSEEEVEE